MPLYKALVFNEPMEADALFVQRYQIMKAMGWDYFTYQRTPHKVIEQVWAFMQTENKVMNEKLEEKHG